MSKVSNECLNRDKRKSESGSESESESKIPRQRTQEEIYACENDELNRVMSPEESIYFEKFLNMTELTNEESEAFKEFLKLIADKESLETDQGSQNQSLAVDVVPVTTNNDPDKEVQGSCVFSVVGSTKICQDCPS